MNEIFGIKGVEIGNVYNFPWEDMVSKPTVVELEPGGLLGGLALLHLKPSKNDGDAKREALSSFQPCQAKGPPTHPVFSI